MKKISTLFLSVLFIPAFAAYAKHHEKKKEADSSVPPVVTPGVHGVPDKAGTPPSDAIVLFDGKNFNEWEAGKGGEVKWKLVDGAMEVVRGGGDHPDQAQARVRTVSRRVAHARGSQGFGAGQGELRFLSFGRS